jgi:hypothetical protein
MEGFQALRGMNGPQRFNIHRFLFLALSFAARTKQ